MNTSRYAEIAALGVIALLVAVGGRAVLAGLAAHRGAALLTLAIVIAAGIIGMRRAYRAGGDDARLVVTKYVAYLAAAALCLWEVAAPAKWIPGSCIAAAEIALVFDMITIAARRSTAGGT